MKHFTFTFLLTTAICHAHHGQDFFVTIDARVPQKNSYFTFATIAAGNSEPSLEVGLIAGLGSHLAFGLTLDGNAIDDLQANAIAPTLQWALPINDRFRLGATLSYHFFDSSQLDGSHAGHSHGGHTHGKSLRPRFNPDAPPPPVPVIIGDSPATIHLHDEDYYLSRFILECELHENTRLVSNIILAGTEGSDTALGYAIALRHSFHEQWAAGIEAIGDFRASGYHQAIAGIIHTPRHDISLRLGLAQGIGATSAETTGLFGITMRF
jgi:hypothetical protein